MTRCRLALLVALGMAIAGCTTTGSARRRAPDEGWRAPKYGPVRGAEEPRRQADDGEDEPPSAVVREPRRYPETERETSEDPLPPAVKVALEDARGGRTLVGSHPEVVRLALELYGRAKAEGIEVVLISGYRPYKPRKRGARGGYASWHNFGLGFDLNLPHRKGLGDANRHFAEDEAIWRRLGEIGRELGLVWGGDFRNRDIFHFEWHPGHDAWISREDLETFLKLTGPDGKAYQRTWPLFEGVTAPSTL